MNQRQFIVPEKDSGSRLDKWLVDQMSGFSRNQIKHLLDQGKVLVNHRRVVIAGWELEPNDEVEVRIPERGLPKAVEEKIEFRDREEPRRERKEHTPPPPPPRKKPEQRPQRANPSADFTKSEDYLKIIHEDNDLIVIDKPPGVLTEPKSDSPHRDLLSWVRKYLKRKHKDSKGSFVKLVHRLDRDTSGLIVVAKSRVGEQLEESFRSHKVERHYLAIVEGRIENEEGKIELALEKGDFREGKKVRVMKEGMPAITKYQVRERYSNASFLLVEVLTGRTHQVRVHLAEIGHPLVGDGIYGPKRIAFPRQALHACMLAFKHPRTKLYVRFDAKMPSDMEGLIDQLRGS